VARFEPLNYPSLQTLFDHRADVTNTDEMFIAVCDFVRKTTNGGIIKPSLVEISQKLILFVADEEAE